MYEEPTAHLINETTGAMSGNSGRYEKRLRDLAGLYEDRDAFEKLTETRGDEVVYEVCDVRPAIAHGGLIFGTTCMMPGKVGAEFFMTRGHIHARSNRPETYYGESGAGVMLLETPEGEVKTLEIGPKTLVYVPPMWIHRSVNVGDAPLVMSFCYPADSGQDYEVIAQSGGMAVRVVEEAGSWTTTPNGSYTRRTAEEIKAIHATQDEPR